MKKQRIVLLIFVLVSTVSTAVLVPRDPSSLSTSDEPEPQVKSTLPFKLISPYGIIKIPPKFLYEYESQVPPKYRFEYGVSDPTTGDVKEQQEERDGDLVRGQYTVLETDGTVRKVEYVDDGVSGFKALVTKTGPVLRS